MIYLCCKQACKFTTRWTRRVVLSFVDLHRFFLLHCACYVSFHFPIASHRIVVLSCIVLSQLFVQLVAMGGIDPAVVVLDLLALFEPEFFGIKLDSVVV